MSNLWLASTIHCSRVDLAGHLVEHYRKLGVRHFAIFIHADPAKRETVNAMRDCLKKHGVHPAGYYYSGFVPNEAAHQRHWHMMQYANPSDWVLYADADELHEYDGGGLHQLLALCEEEGYDHVIGKFNDRVTETGELPWVHHEKPIWEQFPKSFPVTEVLAGGMPYKIVAARARLEVTNANHNIGGAARSLRNKCVVHHFKWDKSVISRLRRRVKEYRARGFEWASESEAVLYHLESNDWKLNFEELQEVMSQPVR